MSLAEQILVIVFLSCLFALLVALMQAERDAALAEVERLREDAARARWCEEMKADVGWSQVDKRWVVNVGERRYSHPDRNAAIDAARHGGR